MTEPSNVPISFTVHFTLRPCSQCDSWTRSTSSTWYLFRNAENWPPPQTYWIRICIFLKKICIVVSDDPLVMTQIDETAFNYLLLIGSLTPLEFKFHERQEIHVSCSLLYFQCLELCVAEVSAQYIFAERMSKSKDEFYQLCDLEKVTSILWSSSFSSPVK